MRNRYIYLHSLKIFPIRYSLNMKGKTGGHHPNQVTKVNITNNKLTSCASWYGTEKNKSTCVVFLSYEVCDLNVIMREEPDANPNGETFYKMSSLPSFPSISASWMSREDRELLEMEGDQEGSTDLRDITTDGIKGDWGDGLDKNIVQCSVSLSKFWNLCCGYVRECPCSQEITHWRI